MITNIFLGDYNKSMSPTLQRLLLGVMVLSGICTTLIAAIVFLIYIGVLPAGWFA